MAHALRRMCSSRGMRVAKDASNVSRNLLFPALSHLPTIQSDRNFSSIQQQQQALARVGFVEQRRFASVVMTKSFVEERVMYVLKMFDKVDQEKLTPDAHFINDLGLDSLDQVEIIVALENEFMFDIPDLDAERLWTAQEIITFVCNKEDVHSRMCLAIEVEQMFAPSSKWNLNLGNCTGAGIMG